MQYTNAKENTQTQKRIHKRKLKYTNANPNTRTQNQIHERKSKYTREMQSIMGRAKVEWCLFVIVYKNGNINLKIYDQYEYD